MTRDEFKDALDRYGGDLAKWPETLAAAARQHVAGDRGAADDLNQARRLDDLLSAAVGPQHADSALIGRIMSGIGNGHGRDRSIRPTGRLAAWASAATIVSLALGFMVGIAVPQDIGNDAFAGIMFGAAYEEDSESVL